MRIPATLWFPVGLFAIAAAGCAKSDDAEQTPAQAAGPRTVHVTATEFAFQVPDTLYSGLTSFHLMNSGQEPHHLVIIKLGEGMTLADLAKVEPTGEIPAGLVFLGGPNAAPPAGAAEAVVDLTPGHYALICVIPSTDGKSHISKGMAREVTVVQGDTSPQAPPHDLTITLTDFTFEVSAPLTAGHHVIRVENTAQQPHELVLVKLEAGRTIQEMAQWFEKMQGPPPGAIIGGGVAPMSSGQSNIVTVDLVAGEYGFICFLPDATDRKPHLLHGMIKQITVM